MALIPENLDELSADEKRALLARLQGEQTMPDDTFPLSPAQRRLWFLSQFEASKAAYNSMMAWRLKGCLQVEVLEQSLDEIVKRQQLLRTTFPIQDGQAVQQVADSANLPLPVVDLTMESSGDAGADIQYWLASEIQRVFDLAKDMAVRFSLLRLGPQDHVLAITMHHIVTDGWSLNVFCRELEELYSAFLRGQPSPLAPLPLQYADYAAWQIRQLDGPLMQTQLEYWKQHLCDSPAILQLPTDKSRPAIATFAGARHQVSISRSLLQGLKKLSQSEQATLFMTLLAALNVLLYRYTDQDDIVVGSPIAGRNRRDVEGLIGFFVNTLALRIDLSGNPTFRELIARVRKVALDAYSHQDLPFERLVESLQPVRDASYSPVFQVMFGLQNKPADTFGLPQLDVTRVKIPGHSAKVDLTLLLEDSATGIEGVVEYNTDLFEAGTIERLCQHLQKLLDGIVENPDRPITQLSLVTEEEQRQFINWNQTVTDYPRDKTVHRLFEEQTMASPDAIALEYENESLSYHQLNESANQLAHYLQARGVGPEVLVGISIERSLEMVIGLLGILKAGGAYLPLDPDYPQSRLGFMLEDARVKTILTMSPQRAQIPPFSGDAICLDTEWSSIERQSADNPISGAGADNLVYVIYTSGSTGRPKGTLIEHRSAVRLVKETNYVELGPEEVFLQFAPIAFDASTFELWGSLLNGAKLVIFPAGRASLEELGQVIEDKGVTTLWLTSALFSQMAENHLSSLCGVKQLLAGGEALSLPHVKKMLDRLDERRLINGYGPTENTTFTCCHVMTRDSEVGRSVPIGRPISNTTVYILDAGMNPVPVGVPGQLYIGGDGLARGYLNRPEMTAEKFVPNPYCDDPQTRLYATGDQVRYREDGAIEFLGRFDHQVKVRGFRIELGEIESVLLRQQMVSDAVVIVHEDEPGDKRLVAYVVAYGGDAPSESELRDHVAHSLPNYMAPSVFMVLDKLPLTANGKVDRNALPVPEYERDEEYTAPRTELEQQLVEIWAEVLKLERVGVHDNFFDLGGHSLMATQVVSRIREQLAIELPLSEMFEYPTVAELEPVVESLLGDVVGDEVEAIPVADRSGELPLSFAQKRLWFLDQLESGNIAYNIPLAIRLQGELNIDALLGSLNTIVSRHEALRTRFANHGTGPVQIFDDEPRFELTQTDLSAVAFEDLEAEITSRFRAEKARPFDLASESLIRGNLLHFRHDSHVLLLTMHHIICDGWSLGVLFREMGDCYAAFSESERPDLTRLPIQYADYSAWQRQWLSGARLDREQAYWSRQLAKLQILDLPTDRTRPAIQTHNGAFEIMPLDKQLSDQLELFGKDSGITLFMTLLTGFFVMLQRYSGQDDIVIGTPVANRNRLELEGLIGFFVNMLMLRVDCSGNPNFNILAKRVSDVALGAYEHQDIPFEKLVDVLQVERDPSRNPLFQVTFALDDAPLDALALRGLTLEPVIDETRVVHFDLECHVLKQAGGLQVCFAYNTDLFDAPRIRQMLQHYANLLGAVLTEPEMPIVSLPMLNQGEKNRLLFEWNATTRDYPQKVKLHQLFETQAERTPTAPAVEFGGEVLSYGELNRRSNQLARYLQAQGVGPAVMVGLYLERSLELLVGMLGVLKAGGAYVPLDPEYPRQRLKFMLDDAELHVLLIQVRTREMLPDTDAQIVCLETGWDAIAEHDGADLSDEIDSEDPAYVMYTSGSTGDPKGVVVPHRAVCNHMLWMQDTFPLTETDRVLQKTPFSFDASVWEFFAPLMAGARLIMAKPGAHKDPFYLANEIAERQITRIQLVPSLLKLLLDKGLFEECHCLRHVFCGGEALSPELRARFFTVQTADLCNLYGPTEATIDATFWQCDRDSQLHTVPIGRPIANSQIFILDRNAQPVPVGVTGEIHIGGAGLARGYLNRPQLTAERFVKNPFGEQSGARLYRTGDLARYLPDGNIEYLGRTDHQVKLRGFRIELGEIESLLIAHETVRDAVVIMYQDEPGDQRLVAYLIRTDKNEAVIGQVREYLKTRLPEYMVPSVFMVVDKFALTPSGKVDFRQLPEPESDRHMLNPVIAPEGRAEKDIAEVWKRILDLEDIGVEDNFFDLGGDSFLMIQLHTALEDVLMRKIPITDLFRFTTIRSFAHHYSFDQASSIDRHTQLRERVSKQRAAMRKTRSLSGFNG